VDFAGPWAEADVTARTGHVPGHWLDFTNSAPRDARPIVVGDKRFDVHVPKNDFGTTSEDDVDVKICRVS
jgi:hypothetical protein